MCVAAVAAYYGAQNHSKIESVQKQASEVREVQAYHEKQLDSIGADVKKVTAAFRILLSDKRVKAVLVNIFGGIMKCDTIAEAILTAYKEVGFHVPLVVRLEGTNVELARKMLRESGVNIITASGLTLLGATSPYFFSNPTARRCAFSSSIMSTRDFGPC